VSGLAKLLPDETQLLAMYDLLPDVLFWLKDHQGVFVHANQSFVEHVGMANLAQILGKTDYDFSPPHIAKQFVEDDKRVLKGEQVTDRLEMNLTGQGGLAWFTTSKRPLLNQGGVIKT